VLADEGHEHQLEEPREPGRLRRDREERGHRHRRALVGVGSPELERERRDLEREADDDEQDRRVRERELPTFEAGERRGDLGETGLTAGHAVDQAHPEEHHRRRQHADQEELQPGLVRPDVGLPERRHQEPRCRDQLERDEQHQ
jgi:hypothetical protein